MISASLTSADSPEPGPLLLDTSAGLALVDDTNPHFAAVAGRVEGHRLGLAGHANAEFYSVLTRLPGSQRLSGSDARLLATQTYPAPRFLPEPAQRDVLDEFARVGVRGGSVYDALVAAAARHHGCALITCDRRAVATYTRIGVDFELILGDR